METLVNCKYGYVKGQTLLCLAGIAILCKLATQSVIIQTFNSSLPTVRSNLATKSLKESFGIPVANWLTRNLGKFSFQLFVLNPKPIQQHCSCYLYLLLVEFIRVPVNIGQCWIVGCFWITIKQEERAPLHSILWQKYGIGVHIILTLSFSGDIRRIRKYDQTLAPIRGSILCLVPSKNLQIKCNLKPVFVIGR